MYGHHGSTAFPRAADPLVDLAFPPVAPPPHQYMAADSSSSSSTSGLMVMMSSGDQYSSSCSSYSSPSSLASYCHLSTPHHNQYPSSLIQRSVSSHSLQKNGTHRVLSSVAELLMDSDSSSVRRVYSTGDLQKINMVQQSYRSESPLSNESSAIIEGMSKACRYSPEEKKERIERYRSKRNQRNFNKKIKYACRKTLADSRPRIRGRFARNEEIEKNSQLAEQWSHINGADEEYYDHQEDDENWINFLDAFSSNLIP